MRSNSRNGRENRKSAIIITRRLTATKPKSNYPRIATWKPQPIQETSQPSPNLASAKGWGGHLWGRKQYVHRPKAQAQSASPDLRLMRGVGPQTQPRSLAHGKILPMPKYTGPGPELKPLCHIIKRYRQPRNSCKRENAQSP